MRARNGWIPVVLLASAGLFILLYPLPAPGVCFWGWGDWWIGLQNCAWNTSRSDAARFLLPALFGLYLLVGAVWSGALSVGRRVRGATTAAVIVMLALALLALVALTVAVDIPG